jgi:hypothetical protein
LEMSKLSNTLKASKELADLQGLKNELSWAFGDAQLNPSLATYNLCHLGQLL